MKTGTLLAIVLFALVALAHALRLIMSVEVTVENWSVPMWVSALGFVVPSLVAYLLYRETQ